MSSRLQDVILRDTRANQPLATLVSPGALYYVTDEGVTERCADDGLSWEDVSDSGTGGINQLTGDVTAGPGTGSQVATIAANAVTTTKVIDDAITNAKLANMAINTVKGNDAVGTDPQDLSSDELSAILDTAADPFVRTSDLPAVGINQLTGHVTAGPGSGSQVATVNTTLRTRSVAFVIDGGGSAITTGVKGDFRFPIAGTIVKNSVLGDQSGSIVIDIWKNTFSTNSSPTVANTITASAKPTITATINSEDSTLTGWTTSVSAGDCFRINVDSISTLTRVTLTLDIQVTG